MYLRDSPLVASSDFTAVRRKTKTKKAIHIATTTHTIRLYSNYLKTVIIYDYARCYFSFAIFFSRQNVDVDFGERIGDPFRDAVFF